MSVSLLRLRYALRRLVREPILTCTIILVLGVGIGANTLMFMILDRLLLRPLPFATLDRLVAVWETDLLHGVAKGSVSPENFLDWQAQTHSFDAIAAIKRASLSIRTPNGDLQVQGARVTKKFFLLFPSRVALGHLFRLQESGDFESVAVISYGLWQRAFGSDPGIVGRTVDVDGRLLTILGVLRSGEEFPAGVDVWIPMRLVHDPNNRGSRSLLVIAGLKRGLPRDRAQAEMDGIARELRKQFPETNAQSGVMLSPFRDELVANYRSVVWLVFAGFGLILLIVCVNVTNMLLVRAAARRKEFAISIALGAERGEIFRQLTMEILLLVWAGAVLGMALSSAGRVLLQASTLGRLVRAESLTLDLRILAFTLVIVLVAGSSMVLIPGAQFLGIRLNVLTTDEGDLSRGKGRRVLGLQRSLVVLQLAISLPLVVTAILLFQNLRQISEFDLGFNPTDVSTWKVSFSQEDSAPGRRVQIVAAGLARVHSLPGVQEAGIVSDLPFGGSRSSGDFLIVDRKMAPGDDPSSDLRIIAGDYFRALGIPVKQGRAFSERDGRFAPGVAIINEGLARRYWPDENPIGQRIRVGAPEEVALLGGSIEREIVGVVGDVVHEGLGGGRRPEIYLLYGQNPSMTVTLAVRTIQDHPASLTTGIANSFAEGRTELLISNARPMRELVSRSLGFPEVQTGAVVCLSVLALLLIGMSVYAVISYFLAQMRHSLVVRIALGAQDRDILWLLAQQGLFLCLGGTAVGAMASLALARLLTHQIHLLQPRALPAILLGAVLVIFLTLATSLVPTRRILGREPGSLLRYE